MARTHPRSKAHADYRARSEGIGRQLSLKATELFEVEETAGMPLILAAIVALAWANSPWARTYEEFWTTKISLNLSLATIDLDLRHAINDFLMPLFFFTIGLELKHELAFGELSSRKRAMMPLFIGLGGMVAPVAIYLAMNLFMGGKPNGWAIPMATDIAFALAIIVLLGDRVPPALKILTLAFAAVDDVGGVLAIAIFYSHDYSFIALGIAIATLALFVAARLLQFHSVIFYVLLGIGTVVATYASGIHTTIAGVALGLLVSARPNFSRQDYLDHSENLLDDFQETRHELKEVEAQDEETEEHYSKLESLREKEETLLGRLDALTAGTEAPVKRAMRVTNPWASYLVLPIFALANTGVTLAAESVSGAATSVVAWGIFFGLIVGKPLGILVAAYAAQKSGLAQLPKDIGWHDLFGMAMLAAIGFTVSLFIAGLAFTGQQQLEQAKIGILAATLLASFLGGVVLYFRPSTEQSDK